MCLPKENCNTAIYKNTYAQKKAENKLYLKPRPSPILFFNLLCVQSTLMPPNQAYENEVDSSDYNTVLLLEDNVPSVCI